MYEPVKFIVARPHRDEYLLEDDSLWIWKYLGNGRIVLEYEGKHPQIDFLIDWIGADLAVLAALSTGYGFIDAITYRFDSYLNSDITSDVLSKMANELIGRLKYGITS